MGWDGRSHVVIRWRRRRGNGGFEGRFSRTSWFYVGLQTALLNNYVNHISECGFISGISR